MSKRRRREVED